MQKKQAVEQRIRELVEIDERRGPAFTHVGVGSMYIKMPIQLHHVLMAMNLYYWQNTMANDAGWEWYVNNLLKRWQLDKPFDAQGESVFDFLHDLLIENV